MAREHWRGVQFLYNATLLAAVPLLLLYLLYRLIRGKSREGWTDRMGWLPESGDEPVVWVHAVSAGEAVAAEAVLRALRPRIAGMRILYTVGTPEGKATALKRMGDLIDCIGYMPYDLPWLVARAFDRVRPRLFVLVESELWPNLLHTATARGVPVLLANGYVSAKTLRKGRWVPVLYRWIFANIRSLCVQSAAVRDRAIALGAAPERVRVVGSVKYDQATAPLPPERVAEWRSLLRLRPDEPVLVAGSTHAGHPGEEELVLQAYQRLRAQGTPVRLILAPRHVQRAGEVEALIRAAGLPVVRRTRLRPPHGESGRTGEGENGGRGEPETERRRSFTPSPLHPFTPSPPEGADPDAVILLDTMGELAGVFSLATVVFLGGSLVPVGGHDILQPLIAGKPVLLGPYTHRQRETVEDALAEGVAWEVSGPEELARRAGEIIATGRESDLHARRAAEFVASRRGASERCAEEAALLLREAEEGRADVSSKARGRR